MNRFRNRKSMAWMSFVFLIVIGIINILGMEAGNESIINNIIFCLTSIIITYYGGVSYENVRKIKNDK